MRNMSVFTSWYPSEMESDGEAMAPHHYIYSMVAGLCLSSVWFGAVHGPWVSVLMVSFGMGLFGFVNVWKFYPRTGACLSILGVVGVVASVAMSGSLGTRKAFVLVCACVAVDDVISHAFGVWTPLDAVWNGAVSNYVR